MKQNRTSRNFWIGLTTVVALFLFYFGFNFLKGRNIFDDTEEYYVRLSDTGGLSRSAPVIINGYSVGKVKDLKFDFNHMESSAASISLDHELKLPKGTVSYVEMNPLGGAVLVLEVGKSGEYYAPGDTIESRVKPGLIQELEEVIAPKIARSLNSLDSLIATVNAVVADPNITATLSEFSASAANIRNTSAQLNSYMAGKVPSILNNIDSATYAVNHIAKSVPTAELEQAILDFKGVVANLQKVSTRLNGVDSSIGLLLNDPVLYRQLQATVSSADSLLTDIKKNPKRYLKISVF